jgi:hypothetical protein
VQRGRVRGPQPVQELREPGRPAHLVAGGVGGRLGHLLLDVGAGLLLAVAGRDQLAQQLAGAAQGAGQPAAPGAGSRPVVGAAAVARRAQPGGRLVHVHLVGAGEQGEQVVGIVAVVGGQRLAGPAAGQHRREGVAGPLGGAGGVAVPGGPLGQPGQVGEGGGVDVALGVEQRVQGQLVEGEHHDRGPPGRTGGRPGHRCRGALGQHQGRGRGGEQEQPGRQQRPHRRHPQDLAEQPDTQVERGPGQAGDDRGDGHGPAPDLGQLLAHLHGQGDQQAGDQGHVHGPAPAAPGQPAHRPNAPQQHRRHHGDGQRQQDDVQGADLLHQQEVGAAADQVEQRLGDGQPAQAGQLQERQQLPAAPPGPDGRWARLRGCRLAVPVLQARVRPDHP